MSLADWGPLRRSRVGSLAVRYMRYEKRNMTANPGWMERDKAPDTAATPRDKSSLFRPCTEWVGSERSCMRFSLSWCVSSDRSITLLSERTVDSGIFGRSSGLNLRLNLYSSGGDWRNVSTHSRAPLRANIWKYEMRKNNVCR